MRPFFTGTNTSPNQVNQASTSLQAQQGIRKVKQCAYQDPGRLDKTLTKRSKMIEGFSLAHPQFCFYYRTHFAKPIISQQILPEIYNNALNKN